MSAKTTKKASSVEAGTGDLLPEYRFDYTRSKPNRFAAEANVEPSLIILDPDVAEVFTSSEAVNKALRAIIEAYPSEAHEKRAA